MSIIAHFQQVSSRHEGWRTITRTFPAVSKQSMSSCRHDESQTSSHGKMFLEQLIHFLARYL